MKYRLPFDSDDFILCLEPGDPGYGIEPTEQYFDAANHPIAPPNRLKTGTDPQREKKLAFLAYYENSGNLREACKATKTVLKQVEVWQDDDTDFKLAFARAQRLAGNMLETEAKRRAVEGMRKYKFDKGYPVYWRPPVGHSEYVEWLPPEDHPAYNDGLPVQKAVHYYESTYSDGLLMFLMKGTMPEKYGDNSKDQNEVATKLYDGINLNEVGSKSVKDLQASGECPSPVPSE